MKIHKWFYISKVSITISRFPIYMQRHQVSKDISIITKITQSFNLCMNILNPSIILKSIYTLTGWLRRIISYKTYNIFGYNIKPYWMQTLAC